MPDAPSLSRPAPAIILTVLLPALLVIAALYDYYGHIQPDQWITHFYNLLGEGFLAGHTWLPQEPSAELLAKANPYDPAQHRGLSLWDASLYHGKYYLYFGPVPALLLWMPVRLLTGMELSDNALGFGFALIGTACLGWLLASIATRLAVTSRLGLWIAVLTLGLASWLPFMLRRASVYEVAIAGAYGCSCMGLLLLWHGLRPQARHAPMRLALASLFFGLAVGCRLSHVFNIVVLIVAWVSMRQGRTARMSFMQAVWLFLPWGLCLMGLAAYNYARFDSVLESGIHYQLTFYNSRSPDFKMMQAARIIPNLYFYLFRPLPWRPDGQFPFVNVTGEDAIALPGGIIASTYEPVYGLLTNCPFSLWLLAIPYGFAQRRVIGAQAGTILLAAAAYGFSMLGFMLLFFFATTRYAVDFAPWLMFLAGAMFLLVLSRARTTRERTLVLIAGGASALYSIFNGTMSAYCGQYLCTATGG